MKNTPQQQVEDLVLVSRKFLREVLYSGTAPGTPVLPRGVVDKLRRAVLSPSDIPAQLCVAYETGVSNTHIAQRSKEPAVHNPYLTSKGTQEPLYYLQDSRSYTGNSMRWWEKGGGYTTDLGKAEKFTLLEASKHYMIRDTDLPWTCSSMLAVATLQVDMQSTSAYRHAAPKGTV